MSIGFKCVKAGLVVLFLVIVSGCASISYDEQADQQLTSLVQKINQQFIKWENQAKSGAAVPYDQAVYDGIQADITTLEIRMEASQDPATEKLVGIFESLNRQIETISTDHKTQGKLSAASLHVSRLLLNAQLATLITFELSLKGTQPTSTAKTDSTATATTQQAAKKASGK